MMQDRPDLPILHSEPQRATRPSTPSDRMEGRVSCGERRQSVIGWVLFLPGQQVRCPACKKKLGIVGKGHRMRVRRNPHGRLAAPSEGAAYSGHCRHCDENLESVQEEVA